MKPMKTLAFAALLSATALGYSINANADQSSAGTASSGGGLSAQSSSGRADASMDATGQSLTTTNNVRANGSTSEGSFDNASTPRSSNLNTTDTSSTDSIPANGAKNTTSNVTGPSDVTQTQPISVSSVSAMSSDQISSIQTTLKAQGFKLGSADGIWGPKSERALREFQARNSLSATGELDSATLSALNVNDARVHTTTDVRVMNDANSNSGSTADAPIDGPDAAGRLNGNSSTSGTDSGSGTGY